MTGNRQMAPQVWRWALIVSSLFVVAENVAVRMAPQMRHYTGVSAFSAILSGAALVFLFFESPVLLRSQGWLAATGWAVAVITILWSVL